VLVDPALTTQGLTAQGRFVWRLTTNVTPPPSPPSSTPTVSRTPSPPATSTVDPPSDPPLPPVPPDPVPPATTVPPRPTAAPAPSSTSAPAPSATDVVTPSASASATATGRPSSHPATQPGGEHSGAAGPKPDLTLGGTLAQLQEVVGRAQQAAADVVSSPQYPLSAISLAMGFLLVQDLIDRRDPKLAVVSRSQRDNEVTFPDRFTGSRSAARAGSRSWLRWPWDDAGGAA